MKINEINVPKRVVSTAKKHFSYKNDEQDDSLLDNAMKKMGWHLIGTGFFSNVYFNSKKKFVLKINTRPDLEYQRYVDVIKKYKNKHFPMISDIKKIRIGGNIYGVYSIEKLKELNHDNWNMVSAIFYEFELRRNSSSKKFYNDMEENEKQFLDNNPEFVKALEIVKSNKQKSRELDLSPDNVMQREDGTLVITDPYS
jgi:hypothetical protein